MFEYLSQQAQLGKATLGFEDNNDTLEYLVAYSMLIVSQLILSFKTILRLLILNQMY